MKKKLSTLTILFSIILAIQFTLIYGYPSWTFTKGSYIITNKLLLYFSILGLILCLTTLFKLSKGLRMFLAILFAVFFVLNVYSEFNPIDTTTEPIDKEILSISADKKKLIVRQRINAKTNSEILDTVLVKDFGIFRQIIQL